MRRLALVAAVAVGVAALPKHPKGDRALKHEKTDGLTVSDKLFCIGPNKAGTSTLFTLFMQFPGEWRACHDICEERSWSRETETHNKDSPVFANHRAFMDNGDIADLEWLDNSFPNSRFVLNTRAMFDWLVSRFDMVRELRVKAGCKEQGDSLDCPGAEWGDNSDDAMLSWIAYEAAHQRKVFAYFNETADRRNRFIVLDIDRSEDALHRLHWVARDDLSKWPSEEVIDLDSALPEGFAAVDHVGGPREVPVTNTRAHDEFAIDRVSNVLLAAGCWQDTWNDQLFVRCDDAIFKRHGKVMANLTQTDEDYLSTVGNATLARVLGTFSNKSISDILLKPARKKKIVKIRAARV